MVNTQVEKLAKALKEVGYKIVGYTGSNLNFEKNKIGTIDISIVPIKK